MTAAVAIVGASLAGLSAARALRAQSYDGRIVVIGDEPECRRLVHPELRGDLGDPGLPARPQDLQHAQRAIDGLDQCGRAPFGARALLDAHFASVEIDLTPDP